jgi:hypothetical protein
MRLDDRRTPHVTRDQLRRDLREADEDRYYLMAALDAERNGPGAPPTFRIVLFLTLLTAAFGSAFWSTRAPALSAADRTAVPVIESEAPVPVATPAKPAPAPAAALPLVAPAAAVPTRTARPRAAAPPAPRPAPRVDQVPRPLHPGEFGRQHETE